MNKTKQTEQYNSTKKFNTKTKAPLFFAESDNQHKSLNRVPAKFQSCNIKRKKIQRRNIKKKSLKFFFNYPRSTLKKLTNFFKKNDKIRANKIIDLRRMLERYKQEGGEYWQCKTTETKRKL